MTPEEASEEVRIIRLVSEWSGKAAVLKKYGFALAIPGVPHEYIEDAKKIYADEYTKTARDLMAAIKRDMTQALNGELGGGK